ncbi:hypothetical protein ACFRCW_45325 [Streptomyces sp. NPDC056653]|uniref:hypothetical protein n=1 Tax=Streptomyces sp. NPDC056653 TaxID=3345894 RepID=UPI0036AE7BF9
MAFFGLVSSVRRTSSATCSSVTVRARPGQGASPSPSSRWVTNRARVSVVTPNSRATELPDRGNPSGPTSAQPSTIRARNARDWGVD